MEDLKNFNIPKPKPQVNIFSFGSIYTSIEVKKVEKQFTIM
jgi:hypothetical protein